MNSLVNLFFLGVFVSVDALAQTPAAAPAQQPPGWMQFVPFIIIIGVFYFLMIRPQAKKQREMQSFLQSLKVGDQIITHSGILGRIASMNDLIVHLEVANNVQIKVLRSQIAGSQAVLQDKKEGK